MRKTPLFALVLTLAGCPSEPLEPNCVASTYCCSNTCTTVEEREERGPDPCDCDAPPGPAPGDCVAVDGVCDWE